jgi:hypothetical protein
MIGKPSPGIMDEVHLPLLGNPLFVSSHTSRRSGWRKSSGRSPLQMEAEACFQRALDIARRQGAKSLELRAALSLSGLWRQ